MEHAQRVAMHIYFIKDVVLVLILILMEHAQRVMVSVVSDRKNDVLILILMEHAQRYKKISDRKKSKIAVLILILMEHAQRCYEMNKDKFPKRVS